MALCPGLQANDSDLKNELAKLAGSDAWDAARLVAAAQAKARAATQPARALGCAACCMQSQLIDG